MSINEVLAENLSQLMKDKELTQQLLAAKSGIGQTTISLYLSPERRQPGKTGKIPSAKLTEVETLADALGVEPWELLRPMTPSQRAAYKKLEEAFAALAGLTVEAEIKSPPMPFRKAS